MKNFKLLLIIILPSLLFAIILGNYSFFHLKFFSLYYYPFSFGLIIAIVNWKKNKYNFFLGTFLSILISHITFFLSFFSMELLIRIGGFVFGSNNSLMNGGLSRETVFIISPFLIAPILVFLTYKFLFDFKKSKVTIWIIITTIALLILQAYFFFNFSEFSNVQVSFKGILNPFNLWQIIMAIAFQLIIYQDKILKKI